MSAVGQRSGFLCLTVLALSFPGRAAADERPPTDGRAEGRDVNVNDLLRMLKEKSPQVAVERARVGVAAAETVAARAYPNPTLGYELVAGLHGADYVNGTQHEITLEQPVLVAGQRGARRTAADRGVTAARARSRADYLTLVRDARTGFVALLAAQERLEVLDQALVDVAGAKQVVEGRAQSGMMSQYDTLRIDVELQALAARRDSVRADADDRAGQLSSLLGLPQLAPPAVGDLGKFRSVPTARVDSLPNVAAARAEEAAATSQIDVARRERWPTPTFGVGALVTTNGYTFSGELSFSTDLPFFDRGQGPIARASAGAALAAHSRALAVAEAQAELGRAQRTLSERRQALDTFEHKVVARLPELRRMGEDAYRSGQGGILDLLDTLRTITDARVSRVDYQEAAARAEVDALAAAGVVDTEDP